MIVRQLSLLVLESDLLQQTEVNERANQRNGSESPGISQMIRRHSGPLFPKLSQMEQDMLDEVLD